MSAGLFKCPVCGMFCPTADKLKIHQATHTDPVLGCDQCDQRFNSQYNLKLHYKMYHQVRLNFTLKFLLKIVTHLGVVALWLFVKIRSLFFWCLFFPRESSTSANIVRKPLRHRTVAWRTSVRFIGDEPNATSVVTAARCVRNPE